MLKYLGPLIAITLASTLAQANQYAVFIDIDTEEGLYDLQVANIIDEETLETLVELLQRGVDLNRASRRTLYALPNLTYSEVDAILAYRDEVGYIDDPASLVIQGILSQEKLGSIAAFLVLQKQQKTLPISGMVRLQTRYSIEDTGVPASALQLRARGLQGAKVGLVAYNTRTRIGNVRYDPARQALTAEAPNDTSGRVPKFYASWDGETASFVAGTYRIGFGQRLTFDNTDQIEPDGFYGDHDVFRSQDLTRRCKESAGELLTSPCTGAAGDVYITPDYRSSDSLLGVAASLRLAQLRISAFASYQPRSIYQYELYSPTTCDNPRDDDDELCKAPDVYVTNADPLQPSPRHSFQSLPNVFAEALAGGNASYRFGRRTQVGVTGYGSHIDWLVEGMELDFQEWSAIPWGGDFGAVGVDGSHGVGNTDLFLELTRSFDSTPNGGGGLGGLARSVTAWGKNEIESSLRYYDDTFQNPHGRPIAAADEFEGLRARDEIGARVRYTGELSKRFRLRSKLDLWTTPSDGTKELLAFVRGDIRTSDLIRLGLWVQYQDKDLGTGGREQCYSVSVEFDEDGEPIPCAGQKLQLTSRIRISPSRTTWIDLQAQHELLDDQRYNNKFRQDISAFATLTTKPHKKFRLRARSRFLFEDISDNEHLEKTLWTYFDLSYRLRTRDNLRMRYDFIVHLDDRAATQDRQPSPEHWLWAEYQANF